MFLLVFICVVISLLAWKLLKWVWLQPRRLEKLLQQQGLRGNPYRLLYGDMKEMSVMFNEARSKPLNLSDDIASRVIPPYVKTLHDYGRNSYLWIGPKPAVLILEPDMIKEVTNKFNVFQKSKPNPLAKLLVQGLFFYEGEKWAKHRKILNPAFLIEKLKLMLPAFYESVNDMLSNWNDIASEKGGTIEIDVWPHLQTMTSDVISRTAFGSDYEQGRRLFELQLEQAKHFSEANRSLHFPGSRFFPTKRHMRMNQIAKEVNNSIKGIINARIETMKERNWNGDDLLGLLLESNSQETGMDNGNPKAGMTIQEVIEECKLFYFAGQETTSVLLVWTLFLLSRFPDWQSRARDEVLQIFGTTGKPDLEGLNRLKTVNMILLEVMRLYTPISLLLRETVKETKIGNLTLPAEVTVIIPTMLVHTDPGIWGNDAKEFNPERFAEGVSHATKGQVVFFPFGWGSRICIGQNFAMLEAKMSLAMILRRFSFELSSSYTHAPDSAVTLQPQHGAHLILHQL